MFDLDVVLEQIPPEDIDMPIDVEFISSFLGPFFPNMPPADLAAKVAEVVSSERLKDSAPYRSARKAFRITATSIASCSSAPSTTVI